MLSEELGLDPSPELRELERMILAHDPGLAAPAPASPRSNLPLQLTPFVGRRQEVADVVGLVRGGTRRLVTLTGPGGSGKTRLAVEAAEELADDFPSVHWVALQALRDPKLVLSTVAGAVEARGDLTRHIGEKQMLLVVDNCEHLPEAAFDLASLLSACPNLVVLTTSREPLRVAAEREYEVQPMSREDAVSLFCERAYRVQPSETVVAICEKLDRLPLAVELAAARTNTLDLDDVLARLDERLDFLTGGPQDAPTRQQTLRATIDWSYDLLSSEQQRAYSRFAVFRGGATLAAARIVCDPDQETLDSLCERHLLNASGGRYSMLETIREHARECLERSGDAETIPAAHARWFLDFAEEFAADVPSALMATLETYRRWIPRVEADLDNFRAAMRWSIDHGQREQALRLACGLYPYWARGGRHLIEGAGWLAEALSVTGDAGDLIVAQAEYQLGISMLFMGRPAEGVAPLESALESYRAAQLGERVSHSLRGLAMIAVELGELERGRSLWAEVAALQADGVAHLIELGLGELELDAGNLPRARELFEHGLQQAIELEQPRLAGALVSGIADVDLLEGHPDRAACGYREALEIQRAYAWDAAIVLALSALAAASAEQGDLRLAGLLWGAAQNQLAQGVHFDRERQHRYTRLVEWHTEPDYLQALEEGRGLSLDEAVAFALEKSA